MTSRQLVRTAVVAGTLSGIPSTVIALVRRQSLLESTRAAGSLVGSETVLGGAVAHGLITLWWTGWLALILPRRHRAAWGAVAGLTIAALDLGVVARRYPAVAALDPLPQVLDHVAYGVVVGLSLPRPPS